MQEKIEKCRKKAEKCRKHASYTLGISVGNCFYIIFSQNRSRKCRKHASYTFEVKGACIFIKVTLDFEILI